MIPSRHLAWVVQTSSQAWTGLWRFLLVFVPICVVFGTFRVATGEVDFEGASVREALIFLPVLFANLYLGAFLLAAIVGPDPQPQGKRYLIGWTAAGAVVIPAVFAMALLIDPATRDPQGPFQSPLFWAFLPVGGAFTGLMYGYHARWWRNHA